MELEELKNVLDIMYGFDIGERTRTRSVVYAKKVYIQLARTFGYDWVDMKNLIQLSHDNCIFHYKSFGDIKPKDLQIYNGCIDYFKLPMKKYQSVESINGSPLFDSICDKISGLGRRDMKYLDDKLLTVFFKKLDQEKKLKNIQNRATI